MAIRVITALAVAPAAPASAQPPGRSEPIEIGTSYHMRTQDADRRVNVALPASYSEGDRSYPLVVMLDGGLSQDFFLAHGLGRWNQMWQRSAPAIHVGIETVDRQRELLPPSSNAEERGRYPSAGRSGQFREWLAETVLPMLRNLYRTDGRAFLIGESAAGHFVVETWMEHPELFDGYAAISPSLQWDNQALSRRSHPSDAAQRPPMFLSLADEGGATREAILRLAETSGACFANRQHTRTHATALYGLLPEALQFLLPTDADWLSNSGLTVTCESRIKQNPVID